MHRRVHVVHGGAKETQGKKFPSDTYKTK